MRNPNPNLGPTEQLYFAPRSNPDNSPACQRSFVGRIAEMTDDSLETYTERIVWLSAFAANNPRSCYHWQVQACYDEAERRGKPEIYSHAYAKSSRS